MADVGIHQNTTVFLPDLARTDVIITGTFENCEIHGPAIVGAVGPNEYIECTFGYDKSINDILWEMPAGSYKIGAIGLQGCRFVRCRFKNIGFVGPRKDLEKMRRAIGGS
jgi:hypothetical protein